MARKDEYVILKQQTLEFKLFVFMSSRWFACLTQWESVCVAGFPYYYDHPSSADPEVKTNNNKDNVPCLASSLIVCQLIICEHYLLVSLWCC